MEEHAARMLQAEFAGRMISKLRTLKLREGEQSPSGVTFSEGGPEREPGDQPESATSSLLRSKSSVQIAYMLRSSIGETAGPSPAERGEETIGPRRRPSVPDGDGYGAPRSEPPWSSSADLVTEGGNGEDDGGTIEAEAAATTDDQDRGESDAQQGDQAPTDERDEIPS